MKLICSLLLVVCLTPAVRGQTTSSPGPGGSDLMSILGNVPGVHSSQGGGGGSLLNSIMGGGGGGAGGANSLLGGAGPLSMSNAVAPKPRRRNNMEMMIPAMAMSSGMDGPWGAMAMAQAMRRGGGGSGGLMRNPMLLFSMMSGGGLGEMLGF